MKMEKKKLSLTDILEIKTEELEIPGIGTYTIRCPKTREKIDARVEATKTPGWADMSEDERNTEISRRLSLKMLIEPKITEEQFMEADYIKTITILDTIALWYAAKIKELYDKRKDIIDHFLTLMKE